MVTTSATSTFTVTGWDEKPFDEIEDGPRLTRATVTKNFLNGTEVNALTSVTELPAQPPSGRRNTLTTHATAIAHISKIE